MPKRGSMNMTKNKGDGSGARKKLGAATKKFMQNQSGGPVRPSDVRAATKTARRSMRGK